MANFTCAQCKGTFTRTRTDAEIEAECHDNFGEISRQDENRLMVCGDCYKILMKRFEAMGN